MSYRTFRLISLVALIVVVAAAVASLAGIYVTGLYPGIFVLCLLTFIPLGSRSFTENKSDGSSKGIGLTLLGLLNILVILVVCWMSFVIIHDRVLKDCC